MLVFCLTIRIKCLIRGRRIPLPLIKFHQKSKDLKERKNTSPVCLNVPGLSPGCDKSIWGWGSGQRRQSDYRPDGRSSFQNIADIFSSDYCFEYFTYRIQPRRYGYRRPLSWQCGSFCGICSQRYPERDTAGKQRYEQRRTGCDCTVYRGKRQNGCKQERRHDIQCCNALFSCRYGTYDWISCPNIEDDECAGGGME